MSDRRASSDFTRLAHIINDASHRRYVNTVVGVDVPSIDEVAASLEEFGTRSTRRLFTSHEIESCAENLVTAASDNPVRFAAKEAALKILNVREIVPSWKAIEVRRTASGRLEIVLLGVAAELAH